MCVCVVSSCIDVKFCIDNFISHFISHQISLNPSSESHLTSEGHIRKLSSDTACRQEYENAVLNGEILRPWDGVFYRGLDGIVDLRYSVNAQIEWMQRNYGMTHMLVGFLCF